MGRGAYRPYSHQHAFTSDRLEEVVTHIRIYPSGELDPMTSPSIPYMGGSWRLHISQALAPQFTKVGGYILHVSIAVLVDDKGTTTVRSASIEKKLVTTVDKTEIEHITRGGRP